MSPLLDAVFWFAIGGLTVVTAATAALVIWLVRADWWL